MNKYEFISAYTTIQQIESFIYYSLIHQEVSGKWKSLYPTLFSTEQNKQNTFTHIVYKDDFFLLWKKENLL